MIDQVDIHIKSGNGGDGAISGRHEKFVPRGGPDGGDGGNGGDVIIIGSRNDNTLMSFRYRKNFEAKNGGNGSKAKKHGNNGENVYIKVPIGTQICTFEGKILSDIKSDGEKYIAAYGGRGGYGNVKYASSTNQYPVIAQSGEVGIEVDLKLELKLLADVGIIGAPNAGKSSLLTLLSAAKPKIANYPFTTLEPNLGVVEHKGQDFVMVDIPGLIEGAHQGIGLGHEFLRHIERTKVLVHLVDGSEAKPSEIFNQINKELELFGRGLSDKPQVLALNKIDLEEVKVLAEDIKDTMGPEAWRFHIISAVTGEGVEQILDEVIQALEEVENIDPSQPVYDESAENIPTLRPEPRVQGARVFKDEGVYVVDAPGVERIAERINYEDWMARMQLYRHMGKVGVVRALEDSGIESGDTVRLGTVEWEWE